MADYDYLPVGNGSGDAALMHITTNRTVGATTIVVDSVTNVPAKFIGTSGTLLASGLIDPATATNFKGHTSAGTLIIDAFESGSTDLGNTVGQVVIIKPNTGWANRIASFIKNATGFGTPEALYASSLTLAGADIAPSLMPTGAVLPFAGSAAPSGYLLCQGQAVSRTSYAALFAAIGTSYGAGDGSTTFGMPDLRGGVPVGLKAGDTDFGSMGASGGEKTHLLTTGEMPSHTHGLTSQIGVRANVNYSGTGFNILNNDTSTITIAAAGGGGAHNNLQPFLVVNYIIKT